MKRLGINAVHIDTEQILDMGLNRVEFVLARGYDYAQILESITQGMRFAKSKAMPFSVHLPIFLFDWYEEDYLSAFYLDPDEEKRELSFQFLESNLEALKGYGPAYAILHFPGVYRYQQDAIEFDKRLSVALDRLDALAGSMDVKVLLEYFGSNDMFWKIDAWIEQVSKRKNLGLLCDTGHLYFSSKMHGFDFYEGLKKLASVADAFHLWTTRGEGVYSDSEAYKAYHHIMMHMDQKEVDGFAFDTLRVMEIISAYEKPMIIEASDRYHGREYFIKGIKSIVSFLE
jgi:sugar phosphate isomerase/epimerase